MLQDTLPGHDDGRPHNHLGGRASVAVGPESRGAVSCRRVAFQPEICSYSSHRNKQLTCIHAERAEMTIKDILKI
jgi:hypothetical protein